MDLLLFGQGLIGGTRVPRGRKAVGVRTKNRLDAGGGRCAGWVLCHFLPSLDIVV